MSDFFSDVLSIFFLKLFYTDQKNELLIKKSDSPLLAISLYGHLLKILFCIAIFLYNGFINIKNSNVPNHKPTLAADLSEKDRYNVFCHHHMKKYFLTFYGTDYALIQRSKLSLPLLNNLKYLEKLI
jgi:hypothetical protein